MPSTPDPNYWGNPPQTPRSKNIPQQPAEPAAPQAPYGAAKAQPVDAVSQQASPVQEISATQAQASPQAAPQPNTDEVQAGMPQTGYTAPAAPPAPTRTVGKKKHTGIIITIAIIAVLLLGMGGCAACSAVVSTVFDDSSSALRMDDSFGQNYNYSTPRTEQESLNSQTRSDFGLTGMAALSDTELDNIQSEWFDNSGKAADENGNYAAGVYRVGTDIPAGGYWFTGMSDELSYFYILKPTKTGATTYNTVHINNYYGHNLANLEDGEVLILDNQGTMVSLNQMSKTFSAPYKSGVYRVGTDIPEGTYQLIVGDGADDYSACYVMADLNFDEDSSYLYSDYFVKGDKPETITLKAGTYVELYNMQMKPAGLA